MLDNIRGCSQQVADIILGHYPAIFLPEQADRLDDSQRESYAATSLNSHTHFNVGDIMPTAVKLNNKTFCLKHEWTTYKNCRQMEKEPI